MASPYLNTVARVVEQAHRRAGLLGRGMKLNSEQAAEGFDVFNDMITFQQTQGVKLFTQQQYSLQAPNLQVGVGYYTFGPTGSVVMAKPFRIELAWFQDSSQNQRPLYEMSWQEWSTLGNVSQQGQPNQWRQDRYENYLGFQLWLVPDTTTATGSVQILFRTQVTPATTFTQDTQFPNEWFLPLVWMLAAELSATQPTEIRQRCQEMATYYKHEIEGWDQETAQTFFTPDQRMEYGRRNF